ncbi:MAG: hypothetical protein QOH12_3250 [Solirubrobacteraceae bacterium]|nr:hypothetical protein [Solirubrobacteraceae bacterium]
MAVGINATSRGSTAPRGRRRASSEQGENSDQLLAGGKSGGVLFTEATGGAANQNSTNAEISAQVILG